MVSIAHDWDESDTKAQLEIAFEEYKAACYGNATLDVRQNREVRQAFFSGVHYLNDCDDYSPGDIQLAIIQIFKNDGILQ
jgi:hypothetical protein